MFYNRIRQKIVSGASRKNLKYEWYQNTNDHSVTCRRLSIVIFICVVMVMLQFNKPVSNHLKISIRRTKVQLILIFRLNHVFSRRFGQILQPIFRQFVNLINHNTIQLYSRWNRSNCMLSEKKSKGNWSMLMSSQDITLLLYCVMSNCRYPVSAYSNIFQ